MRNFVIMHETVTSHDAIGNDIELMYTILSKKHYCYVYAKNQFNKNVKYIDEKEFDTLLADEKTIIIYHHSVFWECGYKKIRSFNGKIVFRYHNITPAHFFEQYNEFAYQQCEKGREQTKLLQSEFKNASWLCDSMYNSEDISIVEKDRVGICAPFNKIEEWNSVIPDEQILSTLIENNTFNIMFVGRIAPNKGHLMLLEVIRVYCSYYGSNIKLIIIGKYDEGLPDYNRQIKDRINLYGLESLIELVGEINDQTLMSYYLGSDALLCCSEHEGFCVPIIEAQNFKLPIIALKECAVPETIGRNQILLGREIEEYAAALHKIRTDNNVRNYLINEGRKNYESRFTFGEISKVFAKEMKRMTGVEI